MPTINQVSHQKIIIKCKNTQNYQQKKNGITEITKVPGKCCKKASSKFKTIFFLDAKNCKR